MQFVARNPSTKKAGPRAQPVRLSPPHVDPVAQRQRQTAQTLRHFTARPTTFQRQAAAPVLQAAALRAQETERLAAQQQTLQRQVTSLGDELPAGAVEAALQRQAQSSVPAAVIKAPQSPLDWVTVMRQRAEQVEGQRLDPKAYGQFTALQRQVAEQLTAAFKQDRQPAAERHQAFAAHLASLQRHALSRPVAQVVLGSLSAGERPALQRAVDEVQEKETLQRRHDEQALTLHSLQRQLAELNEQATKPVMERIQARRGSGNPLPTAVQRHLEQGLNHDLSWVRIHDDAEADKLAKGLNAVAFTTGTDIYFRSGKFNPNTQSGLELLAHEVTHTVQQAQGKVGKGVDPDAGLEDEARTMGSKLARMMPTAKSLMPPSPHAPGVYTRAAALRRVQEGAAHHTLLSPLRALQRQTDLTVQRSFVGDKLSGLAGQIPGYTPLTMALGYDPVAGKTVRTNPDLLLDALGRFVPGPFKEMVKVVREQKLIGKAWAWFRGELGRLQLGKVVTDLKGALSGMPNVGKAKDILVKATNSVRQLVLGSARKLAEIALTAITAGLGPVGKQVMGSLAKAGDVITQVLKNPGGFAKNLMNALRQGFLGFVSRSATWMRQGLGDWLTGSANIQLPRNLNVEGVLMTALSIMDLTAMSLERRLIKELGTGAEKKIALLKQAGGALSQLGPGVGKAPEMKAVASRVGGEVIGGIRTEVTETLVKKGIQKVALMFSPAGAAVGAVMTAWSTIQTVIDKGKQIMGVITSALRSVREIAAGNVAGAAKFIEKTIGNALPIVFNFAANFLGLRNIGARIRSLVRGMRQKLGIDKVIDAVVTRLKKIVGAGRQGSQPRQGQPSRAQDESKDTPQSLKVKSRVRQYLQGALPRTFSTQNELLTPVRKTANLFRKEGLKYLRINRQKGIFAIEAIASPAQKVGLSKAVMRFTKSDIAGFGFGGVTLYATINGVQIERKFGPIAGVHAEALLISYIEKNAAQLLRRDGVNHIGIQLSSSPCGEDANDEKCRNCAGTLNAWAQRNGHTLSITFLTLYKGEKNAATTSALNELKDSDRVISLEAWDEGSVEAQVKEKFGGNPPEKIITGLKRKAAAAKRKLEEISGKQL